MLIPTATALPPYITPDYLATFIAQALAEDIGNGDHSSQAILSSQTRQKAHLIVKGTGIIAGVTLAQYIFTQVDSTLQVQTFVADGQAVKPQDIALVVEGDARSILTAERLVLNCMQRMSAIATLTRQYAQAIAHTKAKLLDTRKTTPLFRRIEKWSVLIGGGHNHRLGLYDLIMLKDNHIDYAGGIAKAIHQAQNYLQKTQKQLKIEIETRNLQEVKEAVATGGVDYIMLDNFSLADMQQAVQYIQGRVLVEASGGVNLHTIVPIAEAGVDFISVGALTHSYQSLDMSLKAL